MRKWNIGTNSLYKTALYFFEEGTWYIYFIEKTNLLLNWLIGKMIFNVNLRCSYWMHIFGPISQWCWKHKKYWGINTTWDTLLERHPIEMAKRERWEIKNRSSR